MTGPLATSGEVDASWATTPVAIRSSGTTIDDSIEMVRRGDMGLLLSATLRVAGSLRVGQSIPRATGWIGG
jgi:hypothetical protein